MNPFEGADMPDMPDSAPNKEVENMRYAATITAAKVLEKPEEILEGFGRYQVEVNNATATGSATIEVDFGAGYRLMETTDLTDASRVPFTVEGHVQKIRVAPSESMFLSFSWRQA
jgi:hypothetical protein